MEEKDRELKRARTVRTDYKRDVEEVQSWIQNAELKIQDRSVEPLQLKEYLSVCPILFELRTQMDISITIYTMQHEILSVIKCFYHVS